MTKSNFGHLEIVKQQLNQFVTNLIIWRGRFWLCLGPKYRVINLDWEKVLGFCSQLLLLIGLEFVFFYSAIFDVFCVRILLVWVKYFVHNINVKKKQTFSNIVQFSLSLSEVFFFDLLLFLTGLRSKSQICLSWRYYDEFWKTSLIWDYLSIWNSYWSRIRKNSFDELRLILAVSEKACFSLNWYCGQSI